MTTLPKYVNHEAVHVALSMCCGEDKRFQLRRPFRIGRDVYATNSIIIARVPDWAAPWVTGVEGAPRCGNLRFDPVLYAGEPTPWAKLPKPIVPVCDRCEETKRDKGYDKHSPSSVYELVDFDDPPQICRRCGMYTASETGSDYQLGAAWFNAKQARKLATLGAVMYAPLNPGDDHNEAWRWEIADLHMTGLLMPVKKA